MNEFVSVRPPPGSPGSRPGSPTSPFQGTFQGEVSEFVARFVHPQLFVAPLIPMRCAAVSSGVLCGLDEFLDDAIALEL